jgi:hypothetical protein
VKGPEWDNLFDGTGNGIYFGEEYQNEHSPLYAKALDNGSILKNLLTVNEKLSVLANQENSRGLTILDQVQKIVTGLGVALPLDLKPIGEYCDANKGNCVGGTETLLHIFWCPQNGHVGFDNRSATGRFFLLFNSEVAKGIFIY